MLYKTLLVCTCKLPQVFLGPGATRVRPVSATKETLVRKPYQCHQRITGPKWVIETKKTKQKRRHQHTTRRARCKEHNITKNMWKWGTTRYDMMHDYLKLSSIVLKRCIKVLPNRTIWVRKKEGSDHCRDGHAITSQDHYFPCFSSVRLASCFG